MPDTVALSAAPVRQRIPVRLGVATRVRAQGPELIRQGWMQLTSHRLRSALALCGIIVGVTAVSATLALNRGLEVMIQSSYERFFGGSGAGMILSVDEARRAGRTTRLDRRYDITGDDRASLLEAIPELRIATFMNSGDEVVSAGAVVLAGVRVFGVEPAFNRIRRRPVRHGRFLHDADLRGHARVIALTHTVAERLYGREDVVGRELVIAGQRFEVVGIVGPLGNPGGDQQLAAFVPFDTARARLGRDAEDTRLWLLRADQGDIGAIIPTIRDVLIRRHPGATADHFRSIPLSRFQDRAIADYRTRGRLLGAVALLCLLAGGIGILNVMLISVTERTREIGLRLALGATRRAVLCQFLLEAVLLCLVGGLVGLAAAQGLTLVLAARVRQAFAVDRLIDPALLAVPLTGEAIATGLAMALVTAALFGTWPAWRASRLDPVAALGHE